jgi:hypothetical protein
MNAYAASVTLEIQKVLKKILFGTLAVFGDG